MVLAFGTSILRLEIVCEEASLFRASMQWLEDTNNQHRCLLQVPGFANFSTWSGHVAENRSTSQCPTMLDRLSCQSSEMAPGHVLEAFFELERPWEGSLKRSDNVNAVYPLWHK